MINARRAPVSSMLWSFIAPIAVMAGLQVGKADQTPPTPIERALTERVCTAKRAGTPGSDAFDGCLHLQLIMLRADFGRDLSRLSAAERTTIDATCSQAGATRGDEGYLACLSARLAVLKSRRAPAPQHAAEPTPTPSPSATEPPASTAPSTPAESSWPSGLWIGAGVGIVVVLAAGVLFALKSRRPRRKCRVCATAMTEPGDLCQKCRREAADTLRRAAADRAEQLRVQDEEPRRKREFEEAQRRQREEQEEDARRRQQDLARQQEDARMRDEEARRLQQHAQEDRPADDAAENVFDPYAALGVPRDADREAIEAAYQEAKSKYDPDRVAHLSNELQDHYKEKADAADRAYRTLTG